MHFRLQGVRFKDILDIPELELGTTGVTCIIGESGSGKTTLLRLLNDMISPDHGQITYQSININEYDPTLLRRRVLMLPQNPSIFPGTIRENLLLGLEFAGLPAQEDELLKQALSMAKLTKPLQASAEELSGGEKQRLALARIMLMDPEVLLLDEPSAALDEDTEKVVINSIVDFAKSKGISLIMVTHSKSVANNFGDTVITIQKGTVSDVKELNH